MKKMIVLREMPEQIVEKHKRIVKKVNASGHLFYVFVRPFYDRMLDEIEKAANDE